MERLLKDAQEFSGVEYDIDNLGDVYEAIHVIQEDLGLTGVAAEEAATTFSGSFGAMKAAAANVMANLALGKEVLPSLRTLGQSIKTFLIGNVLPMLSNIVEMIPMLLTEIPTFLADLNPDLIPAIGDMVSRLGNAIVENAPAFTEALAGLFSTIWTALSNIDWPGVANSFLTGLQTAMGSIWDSVTELLRVNFGIELPDFETLTQDLSELWENVKAGISEFFKASFAIITDDDKTITQKISDLWDLVKAGIGDFFKATFKLFVPTAEGVISSLSKWWGENIWPSVQDFFQATFGLELPEWETVSKTIAEGWETIKADVAALFNVLFGVDTPSWEDVKAAIEKLWEDVWGGIADFFKVTFNVKIPTWEEIKEKVETLWNDFKEGISSFFKTTFKVKLPSWSDLQEDIKNGWDTVKKGVGSIFSWVFDLSFPDIDGIVQGLKDWWGKIVEGIGSFFTLDWILGEHELTEDQKTLGQQIAELRNGEKVEVKGDQVTVDSKAIQEALSNANLTLADVDTSSIDTAKKAVTDAIAEMVSAFTNATMALPTIGTTALDAVSIILNAYISVWKNKMKFTWTLPTPHGYLPVFSVSMREAGDGTTKTSYPVFSKSLQWFAKGGVFKDPTIIGVGDSKGPEAVVPLDTMWRQMDQVLDEYTNNGATVYQTFNVNGAEDPERWATSVARKIKQELRMG